jgi:putative Mg2+ transporter-C (MgtC) family protein
MSEFFIWYEHLPFIAFMREFNIVTIIIRLMLAAVFGAIIGLERGRQRRAAGLRTHTLVCLGAALTATVGFFARDIIGIVNSDPLRVSAQVISGIGFLGVGTIMLKGRFQIVGLTTAAGLWVTAAIGIALGAGFYEGAIVALIVTVFTVLVLHKFERRINARHLSFGVYTEINSDKHVRECIEILKTNYGAHDVQVTTPRSGVQGNVGIEASVLTGDNNQYKLEDVITELHSLDYVVFATESL